MAGEEFPIKFLIESENRVGDGIEQAKAQLRLVKSETDSLGSTMVSTAEEADELSTAIAAIGSPQVILAVSAAAAGIAAIAVAAGGATARLQSMSVELADAADQLAAGGLKGAEVVEQLSKGFGVNEDSVQRLLVLNTTLSNIEVNMVKIGNAGAQWMLPVFEKLAGAAEVLSSALAGLDKNPAWRIFSRILVPGFIEDLPIVGPAIAAMFAPPATGSLPAAGINPATGAPFGANYNANLTNDMPDVARFFGNGHERTPGYTMADWKAIEMSVPSLKAISGILREVPVIETRHTEAGLRAIEMARLATRVNEQLAASWEQTLFRTVAIQTQTNNLIIQLTVDLGNAMLRVFTEALARIAAKNFLATLVSFIPAVGPALAEGIRNSSTAVAGNPTMVTVNALDARSVLLDMSSPSGSLRAAGYRREELARVR